MENRLGVTGYIVDTDVAIEHLRGNSEVTARLSQLPDLHTTSINIAELFYGIYARKGARKEWKQLGAFLQGIYHIRTSLGSCRLFGIVKSKLKKKGTFVGDADIHIASIALLYDFVLVTRNVKEFGRIEGLRLMRI